MGKGMYGLEWVDENTLKGETGEEEFTGKVWRESRQISKIFPDEILILHMPVFEAIFEYGGMDFRLSVERPFCTVCKDCFGGQKIVKVSPGPASKGDVVRINALKKGAHVLEHVDSGIGRVSIRKRIGNLIELAKKDVRWCKKHGARLVREYDKGVFGKVGRIAVVNGRKKK